LNIASTAPSTAPQATVIKDRRSVRNDIVILHIVYNIMMKADGMVDNNLIMKGSEKNDEG
jgi:hypothetical protein